MHEMSPKRIPSSSYRGVRCHPQLSAASALPVRRLPRYRPFDDHPSAERVLEQESLEQFINDGRRKKKIRPLRPLSAGPVPQFPQAAG